MTREERAEKKRLREVEKERKEKEFPGALFRFEPTNDPGFTDIVIEAGSEFTLTLEKNKTAKWHQGANPGWEQISVNLREQIPALAELIRALVVRYNAIVKDANAHALATPRMEPLAIIDIENPPEVIT